MAVTTGKINNLAVTKEKLSRELQDNLGTKAYVVDYGCSSDIVENVINVFKGDPNKSSIFIRLDDGALLFAHLKSDTLTTTTTTGTIIPGTFNVSRYGYNLNNRQWYKQTFANVVRSGVSFEPQDIKSEYKAQARENIDAATKAYVITYAAGKTDTNAIIDAFEKDSNKSILYMRIPSDNLLLPVEIKKDTVTAATTSKVVSSQAIKLLRYVYTRTSGAWYTQTFDNIVANGVTYGEAQALTDSQKQQARNNIGAGKPVESGTDISVENNKANIAITENITVAGLSDTYGCGLIKNGDTIPKGTSLSKILEMMLTKELMPAAATKPTISITKASVVSGLHEIGESVNVGTATISKTDGHFNNNGWASPVQPTAKFTWSGETMTSQLASGATGYVKQTGASIVQGTAKTVKGTNKVSITASANYSAPTNSPITNLGNTKTDAAYTWTASKASAASTIEWTGVYPCFTNLGKLGTEPTVKLTLQTGATFSISVPSHNAGNNDFRFAYPDGWTISSFKVKSLDGKYYEFAADHNKNAGNLTKTIQGVSVTYHYLTVANGASDYQITLNKALNA